MFLRQGKLFIRPDKTLPTIHRLNQPPCEKYVSEAIALSTLDAPAPNEETMKLMQEYIDGKREISDVLRLTIDRYQVDAINA